jgi:hypothetical protein
MTITDFHPVLDTHALLEKPTWYRIEDREHRRPEIKHKPGDKIAWKRTIARVGYYLSPMEMDEKECETLARKALLKWLGDNWEHGNRVPVCISLRELRGWECPKDARVSEQQMGSVLYALGLNDPLRRLKFWIRGEWLKEQRWQQWKQKLNARTLWFDDLCVTYTGTITKTKRVVLGEWYPGSSYDGEYEPENLLQWAQSRIYEVLPDFLGEYDRRYTGFQLVYPEDIIEGG